MMEQSFSTKNLLSFLSPTDFYKFDLDKENYELKVQKASKIIQSKNYLIKNLRLRNINDATVFSVTSLEDHLALKKLNSNLLRIYKVRQADRETIIHQIKALIQDEIPKWILKFDIKKFYENINKEEILENINENYILAHKSKVILNSIFNSEEIINRGGIPRGLCISGTLSELAMRDFDKEVRKIEGVYFYARYVDDIILFSFLEPASIQMEMERLLPNTLSFNSKKTRIFNVCCQNPKRCKKKCKCAVDSQKLNRFDYLGYKFIFPDVPVENTKEQIIVSIGTSKVKKIKSRIVNSFLDFIKTGDFNLLNKRIQFLTGNYKLNKIDVYSSKLHSGIFYNYKSIDGDLKVLVDLDLFLRKCIYSNRSSFGQKLCQKLTIEKKQILGRYSFKKGFELRITHKFNPEEIHSIKKCWKI